MDAIIPHPHPPGAPGATSNGRYRWLLFDADGTLFDFERAEGVALEQSFRQFGAPFEPGYRETYGRINRELWQDFEQGRITPSRLKVGRFDRLLTTLGLSWPAPAFSEAYLGHLAACAPLLEGAFELVRACHSRYQMAIVTNGLKAVQRGRLGRSPLGPYFPHWIISEEIGAAKPEGRFFDAAFERIGRPSRREVLMIGDNWSSDIIGAAAYGLDTCWFNPRGEPRPATPAITHEVRALPELAAWLGVG